MLNIRRNLSLKGLLGYLTLKNGEKIMTSRIKKFITYILTAILVLSSFVIFAPVANAASAAKDGTVNVQDAHLREQPFAASNLVIKMEKGAKVSIIDTEVKGWYKIQYQNNTGYVRANFIDVLVTGYNDPAVIISDAPVTTQPDPASEVLETIKANTQVSVTGTYGALYQITDGSKSGFISKNNVHVYTIFDLNLKGAINSSGVNLRKTPSASGESIEIMKKGETVAASSIQDHWVKVNYLGKTGYIRGDFINYTIPPDTNITALSPGLKGQMVTDLQILLKKKGFFYTAANGVYGSATKAAVARFQAFAHLKPDGFAGSQTLLLLFGPKAAANLWDNYRSSMPAQKPKQNGSVWLEDWFDYMEKTVKRYSPFEVIDVRTGIHWNMQRFGGWWHADVETMTKDDTEAMKKAWGGDLNPSRRPVWVKIGEKYYAASLMGYVHNNDTIGSNGMDGQICLHFRGSKIHATGHIDESHQACITEAFNKASRLDSLIKAGKV